MRIEIINQQTVVNSITEKYVYSTEFIQYKTKEYFVACHYHMRWGNYGERKAGQDCTLHHTHEEAEAAIETTARVWDWDPKACYIIEREGTDLEVKHHRNKVRG